MYVAKYSMYVYTCTHFFLQQTQQHRMSSINSSTSSSAPPTEAPIIIKTTGNMQVGKNFGIFLVSLRYFTL